MVEVVIATCVHDDFVRPHVGDSLAVLLVNCALRAVTPLTVPLSIASALAVACAIEFGQLVGVLSMLGLDHNMLARIVLSTDFDPKDFIAYGAGGIAAGLGEKSDVPCGLTDREAKADPYATFTHWLFLPGCGPSAFLLAL